MRLIIDTDTRELVVEQNGRSESIPLYSRAAFDRISREWVRVGWNQKYSYTFTWFGRPIIEMPEDMVRLQEVIWRVKPDVIIETGVAHGGSVVYYASLCRAMDKGRVIGVDIEIRPHNRKALDEHPLRSYITLIEGSSTDEAIVAEVAGHVKEGETVLVILDSNHTKAHVAAELEHYAPLVTPGSYIVATDGIMQDLADVPRGGADWTTNNPAAAAREFAAGHPEFVLEQPQWPFNESDLGENITHWPEAWLRRT